MTKLQFSISLQLCGWVHGLPQPCHKDLKADESFLVFMRNKVQVMLWGFCDYWSSVSAERRSKIPLDWGFCCMAGALNWRMSEPMVNSLGGSARLSWCQTNADDGVRGEISWSEVRGWGPYSEIIGFSGNQFFKLKVQLCQSRSPFQPLFLPCLTLVYMAGFW